LIHPILLVLPWEIDCPLVSVVKVVTGSERHFEFDPFIFRIFSSFVRNDRWCLIRRRNSSEWLVELDCRIRFSLTYFINMLYKRRLLVMTILKGVVVVVAC